MLLKERTETVQTSGLGEGNNFTIAASTKAFEVLFDRLYQNKILAPIREVVCNAADAHASVGKDVSTIEVNLPTFNLPSFSVRDYGPGLSDKDMKGLYTTVFQSTKESDPNAIGGFGLGSKSPFAVADQFTVTSWHGGTKSVYVCYKQGKGAQINPVSSEHSTEPSGLLVTVVVKAQDRGDWLRNATNFFRLWPTLPKITGLGTDFQTVWQTDEVLYKSDDLLNGLPKWAIFKGSQPATVFMGLVPYSLNFDNLTKLPPEVTTLLRGASLFLNMPVSSLQISPSRESLSYDPDTVDVLEKTATRIAKGIINEAIKDLDNQPSLYEARKFVYPSDRYNTLAQAIQGLAEKGLIKWRGQRIPRYTGLQLNKVFANPDGTCDAGWTTYIKSGWWKNFQNTVQLTVNAVPSEVVSSPNVVHYVWTDKPISRKTYNTLRHNYRTLLGIAVGATCYIYLIHGVPYDKLCEEAAKLGFPPIDNYDDLEEPPKAIPGSNPNRRPQTSGYLYNLVNQRVTFERSTKTLGLTGGGLWIPFSQGEPDVGNTHAALQALLENRDLHNHDLLNTKIIGISKSRLSAKLQATLTANKWEEFNPAWVAANVPSFLLDKRALKVLATQWLYYWRTLSPAFVSKHGQDSKWPKEVAKFFTLIEDFLPLNPGTNWPIASNYQPLFNVGAYTPATQVTAVTKAQARVDQIQKAWDAVLTGHPMLRYAGSTISPADFSDYVTR